MKYRNEFLILLTEIQYSQIPASAWINLIRTLPNFQGCEKLTKTLTNKGFYNEYINVIISPSEDFLQSQKYHLLFSYCMDFLFFFHPKRQIGNLTILIIFIKFHLETWIFYTNKNVLSYSKKFMTFRKSD